MAYEAATPPHGASGRCGDHTTMPQESERKKRSVHTLRMHSPPSVVRLPALTARLETTNAPLKDYFRRIIHEQTLCTRVVAIIPLFLNHT